MYLFFEQFLFELKNTRWPELIAVLSGIASVWFSKKENILVYPVGLINTIIYVYLSVKGDLYGEASVNFYYTVMSIYGWIIWAKKNEKHQHVVQVTFSTSRQWLTHLSFFAVFYIAIYFSLTYLHKAFFSNTIPWADALASSTAYTGMWLMARKKVESWYWWLATNIVSIPLYAIKGYALTSVYYLILFVLAILGLIEWQKRANKILSEVHLK